MKGWGCIWAPCEPKVVVIDVGPSLLSRVGVGPWSAYEPKVVVDSEAWLDSRLEVGPGSPYEPKIVDEIEA